MNEDRGGRVPSLPTAPTWLPLLVGGLFLYTGLMRSWMEIRCFAYGSVDSWLYDLTRHWNACALVLGAALLLPLTRTLGAIAMGAFALASGAIVLHLKFDRGADMSIVPLFGPCELPFAGQLAVSGAFLVASAWLLVGSAKEVRVRIPMATAVPICAAALFLLTAWLKFVSFLNPPGCLPGTIDDAGVYHEDPLYAWIVWGGRLAIPVETGIAALLLRPATRRRGAILGAGFVVLAASGLAVLTMATGRDLTRMCGCFGPLELPLPAHLAFDGFLLGLLLWTLRMQPARPTPGIPPA